MNDEVTTLEALTLPQCVGFSGNDTIWLHRLWVSVAKDDRSPAAPESYRTITAFDADFLKDAGVLL